jgi:hypothetical protein
MKTLCNSFLGKALLLVLLGSLQAYGANLWISEVLFEPPTDPQTTNEYVELRGTPNYLIPTNTYFVAIDGDADDIGKIRNVFPIGGKRIGNNGFLVLLQKASLFSPDTNAIRLQNTGSEFGWGDDSTSSIGHNGTSGETNIRDATVTFLLLESPIFPDPGTIVDQNNDGTLDGTATNWTVLDSIGVLDSSGADRSYGAITVRNSANTTNFPAGNVVRVAWTAKYVGRNGHTTGSVSNDWVASATLQNNAPSYKTHASQATSGKANTSLNHLGGPNFGAAVLDAVRLTESSGSTEVSEGSTTADSYHLRLNTSPGSGKTVTIEIQADAQIRISTSAGGPFTNKTSVTFNASTWNDVETIYVRSIDDSDVEASPHSGVISHAVTNSTASDYPLTTVIPEVFVQVTDNEGAIFGDVSVNPPGNPDAPGEWIEILAQPNVYLKDLYVLALDGSGSGIGKAYTAIAITNILLGSNGVLFVGATNHPYAIPAGTVEVRDAQFNTTNSAGAFDNNTLSVLLVRSATPILPETDLDPGNTGTLSLPAGAQVMDALGWNACHQCCLRWSHPDHQFQSARRRLPVACQYQWNSGGGMVFWRAELGN